MNKHEGRVEEVTQNIEEGNRKCEMLRDMKLEQGLIYIQYIPQKDLGEHGKVRES